jgi:hypothetical protein
MYEGWTFERWETPVSDLKSIAMVSLVDDGCLKITVEDLRDPARPRWRFTFRQAPIYRNILEEYRLELWELVHQGGERKGWTVTVPSSPWLAQLKEKEPLIEVHHPYLLHFQIGTEDDVIDVLSPEAPLIESVEPAPPDEAVPGKSHVLHADEDGAEVEARLRAIRRGFDDA